MQSSDTPLKLPIPFAQAAGSAYKRLIPTASQVGVVDGAASLTDGFPPLTADPIAAGGKPPDIRDFNGILYEISGWSRWAAAGGPLFYDVTFATAIGGYPRSAVLASATTPGTFWASLVENNTSNPDGGGAGWQNLTSVPANDAQVLAGTDTTRFVTPSGLANKAVSGSALAANDTSVRLVTALALAALRAAVSDLVAGTDGVKYVTPLALAGLRSSASDIYYGSNDKTYVTPSTLAQAIGGGIYPVGGLSWGEYAIPGGSGILVKYGSTQVTRGEGTFRIDYRTPFPRSTDCVMLTAIRNDGSTAKTADVWPQWSRTGTDASGFSYINQSSDPSGTNHGVSFVAYGS